MTVEAEQSRNRRWAVIAAVIAVVVVVAVLLLTRPATVPLEAPKPTQQATKPAAPKVTIAAKYRGEWSLDPASCGSQTDQRLVVGADRINFYGADAPLTRTEEQADGSVEVLAHVTDNTGGYDVVNRYELSDDGVTLTLTGAADQPPVRLKRCPAQST